ncbi:modulator of Rho-dependent transcription termination family protein, partial [Vibrio harveyi]
CPILTPKHLRIRCKKAPLTG